MSTKRCWEVILDGWRVNTGESASAVYQGREEKGAGDGKVRVSVRLATKARGSVWNLRFIKKKKQTSIKGHLPRFCKSFSIGGDSMKREETWTWHMMRITECFVGAENSLCVSQEACCYLEPLSRLNVGAFKATIIYAHVFSILTMMVPTTYLWRSDL